MKPYKIVVEKHTELRTILTQAGISREDFLKAFKDQ